MTAPGEQFTTQVDVAADHPSFAGHFPSHPLLPGVVLIAEVVEAVDANPAARALLGPTPTLELAKFLAPVLPGSKLHVSLRLTGQARQQPGVDFEIQCEGVAVARGRLSPGSPATDTVQP